MNHIAFLDLFTLLSVLAAIVVVLSRRKIRPLFFSTKYILLGLLSFLLAYHLFLFLEWSQITYSFEAFEDLIGAMIPMWWIFIFYAILSYIRKSDLKTSEEKYRSVVQNAIESICVIQDGRFAYWNPVAENLFGYSRDELKGIDVDETVHPEDRDMVIKQRQNRVKGEEASPSYLHRIIKKSGETRWVEVKAVSIQWNHQPAVLVFLSDISERKKADDLLKQAHAELEQKVKERTEDLKKAKEEAEKANRLKNEFLANISHELRTPMHHILGYSKNGVQKARTVAIDKIIHYFSQIRLSGDRLLRLINDLLDLSKLESGQVEYQMEKVDIQEIVNAVFLEFKQSAEEKSITLIKTEPSFSTQVICDKHKIHQVLYNLLSNAIKFTPTGKSVSVFFHLDSSSGEVELNRMLKISLKDEGLGIEKDELEAIFDKFIQSSKTKSGKGGTGLGLSICREIIKAHNGKIWAEKNPEIGSTFSFTLPHEY